jgi:hypothetical protein
LTRADFPAHRLVRENHGAETHVDLASRLGLAGGGAGGQADAGRGGLREGVDRVDG